MIERQQLDGIWTWTPRQFSDIRGSFTEIYNQRALADILGNVYFVQDNYSISNCAGTVRGLHFQSPPAAQDKLVWVVRGAISDVVVDIRKRSPTYGQHLVLTLTAKSGRQIYIPKGFAHGFVTLEPNTEVFYKVTEFYSPDHDRGILWHDPALRIDWGVSPRDAIVSEKDRGLPPLADIPAEF